MKVIYRLHGHSAMYQQPSLVLAAQEVFETLEETPWAEYFHKPVVHFYPTILPNKPKRSAACMSMGMSVPDPEFFFAISSLNAQFALQRFIPDTILGAPAVNDMQRMRLVVGHEVGHWILLKALAKHKCYGKNVFVASILTSGQRSELFAKEAHVNQMSDYGSQLGYRRLYAERWADRVSKILLSKMVNGGKEESSHVKHPII